MNKIKYFNRSDYFPEEENVNMTNLQMTNVGLYSITKPEEADKITNIIIKNLPKNSPNKYTITDGTSGVGGNVISFSKYFKKVNAVELNNVHFDILKHNVNIYMKARKITDSKYKYNVIYYKNSYFKIYNKIKQDIIFLDPPWGGRDYKKKKKVDIYIDNIKIHKIIPKLVEHASLVVLKLPYNYKFHKIFKKYEKVKIHKIKNYVLLLLGDYIKV